MRGVISRILLTFLLGILILSMIPLGNCAELCRMKTLADGYFYIPDLPNINSIQILQYREDDYLIGDCRPTPIDGKIDLKDYNWISTKYGTNEGDANWDYMADIDPDRKCDLKDISKVSNNYGRVGSYSYDVDSLTVEWSNGQIDNVPSDGKLAVPDGVTYFYVKKNGNGVNAYVIFSDEELVTKEWHDIETWNLVFNAMNWNTVEDWNLIFKTMRWCSVEQWNLIFKATQWQNVESWVSTFNTLSWHSIETWNNILKTMIFHRIEVWNTPLSIIIGPGGKLFKFQYSILFSRITLTVKETVNYVFLGRLTHRFSVYLKNDYMKNISATVYALTYKLPENQTITSFNETLVLPAFSETRKTYNVTLPVESGTFITEVKTEYLNPYSLQKEYRIEIIETEIPDIYPVVRIVVIISIILLAVFIGKKVYDKFAYEKVEEMEVELI